MQDLSTPSDFTRNGKEQVLEKAEQRKKKGEKLPPNIDFWKQALGSNLGQRFKSVLYLNQLT